MLFLTYTNSLFMKTWIFIICLAFISGCMTQPESPWSDEVLERDIGLKGFIAAPKGNSRHFLEYDKNKVTLDVYHPGGVNKPVVILVHGSAGISGERAERYRGFAQELMKNDIIGVNVHYFDSPQGDWMKTLIHTVTYTQHIQGADKERIGMIGYSLGGMLALKAGSIDDRIGLVVCNSGPLPPGFTKNDANKLNRAYMISGSQDQSLPSLNTMKEWSKEGGFVLDTKINQGQGHTVTVQFIQKEFSEIVQYVKKYV